MSSNSIKLQRASFASTLRYSCADLPGGSLAFFDYRVKIPIFTGLGEYLPFLNCIPLTFRSMLEIINRVRG